MYIAFTYIYSVDINIRVLMFIFCPLQATSCTALEMLTSSEVLQVILEYIYTDESPTIKGDSSDTTHLRLLLSIMLLSLNKQ